MRKTTYDCDGPECEAEDLIPEFVSGVDLRLPSMREPMGFRDPVRATLHFCEDCFSQFNIGTGSIEWVAVDRRGEDAEVIGVQHRYRPGMGREWVTTFDERDSVVLSSNWQSLFDLVEAAVDDIVGPIAAREREPGP